MNPYNGFILSIILMLPLSDLPSRYDQNCESMKLEVEVAPATDQGSTIKVRVPEDADIRVALMQAEPPGPPHEVRLINGEVRNIAPGAYDIIVVDKKHKYCSEVRKVTVN